MATHSNNFIRVRLHFDYPPPAVVDCRMCWLLVDLNRCRVVGDLEGLIREKFGFSRRSILSLFIEDCYLPHTECVYVVRDNDSVRVKVDLLSQVNGHSVSPGKESETCRKRQRPTEEEQPGENIKKKKKKKRSEVSQERDAKQADVDERKKEDKKKKNKKEAKGNSSTVTPKKTAPKKTPVGVKNIKKPPPPKPDSSSDSSSSSEEEAPKKPAPQKPGPRTPSTSSTPAASKVSLSTKPTLKKSNPPSSSSSETSSDEAETVKNPPTKNKLLPPPTLNQRKDAKSPQTPSSAVSAALPPSDKTLQSNSCDSEDEIQLVIRRPLPLAQQLGRGAGSQSLRRGRGRGRTSSDSPAKTGRGEGRGGNRGHNNNGVGFDYNGLKEPSYQTDSLTNVSVVIENGSESVPKLDYSSMPLLAAPPQVGQKIAFKLLELTENYTPEVSEYKEGKILSFNPTTKQVELELLRPSQAPVEPGKFDLVYQNPDGSERVEYAVSRGSQVTERWDSLLEPRLII
ncbi:coilin [Xyrichtys novacula]|uniref:Coilin n=1 Tax=Xyrichtys novacula TaxID=13765 RepID=A0AAV1GS57_XYRNO|nr:coilin [Xyrichtys novacula]